VACTPQRFSAISRDKFTALQQKAASSIGISITGDSGEASYNGFTLSWDYDAGSELLVMQCLKHPFFAPDSYVESKIAAMVEGS
jgi:hypothetical protein